MKTVDFILQTLLVILLIISPSCQKDETDTKKEIDVSGVVQKGPFLIGASVTISELDETYGPTGRTFTTQTENDAGSFGLENIKLVSPYVRLEANGFYFDEIKGGNSQARLTLNALADINDKSILNVNVLTHLEKPRVEYLLANGHSFSEAKGQALEEVLAVLNITGSDFGVSESMDITKLGAQNSILLTTSSIIQGYRSVAAVSELLANIANDLKEDGTLDSQELQATLISHALYIDTAVVKQNLSDKYLDMEVDADIPGLGSYLGQFINNTSFVPVPLITYPTQSAKGLNILNATNSDFDTNREASYSVAAETIEGLSLKIEMEVIEGEVGNAAWGYSSDKVNWIVSNYDMENQKQTFEVLDTSLPSDLKIIFFSSNVKIRITFMEGSLERTKVISIS